MLPSGALPVPRAETIRPNLRRLTDAARAAGITIVHTADDHDLHDPEIAADPDFVETFPAHCLRGTPGAARMAETTPGPGAADIPPDGAGVDVGALSAAAEIVLRKNRFDAFSNPAAAPLLRALRPERVVIYGVALEVCDRYAVEGMLGLHAGFEIVLVEDAVAALDETFQVRARRARTAFAVTSQTVNETVGDAIRLGLSKRVNLRHPDVSVRIEIVHDKAYVSAAKVPGPGGLPVGTAGPVVALLSAGIDSPVAAWRIMRRGGNPIAVHFHGQPFTDRASEQKVTQLVGVLGRWGYR